MKKINLFLITLISIAATACGPNGGISVKSLDINTSQVAADTYINLDTIVVLGNLKLPNVEVPVLNPKTLQPIGQMATENLPDGTNKIMIAINFQEAAKLDPSSGNSLPNGRALPMQLSSGEMIGIPLMEQSKIYIGGDLQKQIILGAAVAIPALDQLMSNIPIPLNLFFNFSFPDQITAKAGLFTGPSAGESGIAIFAEKLLTSTPSTNATELSEDFKNVDMNTLVQLNQFVKKQVTLEMK